MPAVLAATKAIKVRTAIAITLAILLLGFGSGYAVKSLFYGSTSLPSARIYDEVEAIQGTIERSISLPAQMSWQDAVNLQAPISGVLTQVLAAEGTEVEEGQVVATVNMSPLVVIQGSIPAYRSLTPGSSGPDVRQLQEFLGRKGFFFGKIDGNYTERVASSVRQWQRKIGVPQSGQLDLGQYVFLPRVPAAISWEKDAKIGSLVSPGMQLATLSGTIPEFRISLPEGQAELVKDGMKVSLSYQQSTWEGTIGKITPVPNSDSEATVISQVQGQPVCGNDCASLPALGTSSITANITILEPISGVIVPNTAISVESDGNLSVMDNTGKTFPIQVLASTSGRSVVTGITSGTKLRVALRDSHHAAQNGV